MKDHPANSPPSKDRPLAYRFGPFILHGGERVLRREDGQIVALRPKAFETLLALVEKSGHVLSKDELMERIWPETFVEESGLARNISVLRKALGEGYIETMPKRGYRFAALVEVIEPKDETAFEEGTAEEGELALRAKTAAELTDLAVEAKATERSVVPSESAPLLASVRVIASQRKLLLIIVCSLVGALLVAVLFAKWKDGSQPRGALTGAALRSVAVLPFQTSGELGDDPAFPIGLADALVIRLNGIRRLVIRPTGANLERARKAQDAAEIGQSLGVQAVLTGKIQRVEDRLRVATQLLDVESGEIIWAEKFDLKLGDPFAMQDRVTEEVVRALALAFAEEEHVRLFRRTTLNPEAQKEYSLGLYLWSRRSEEGVRQAVEHFERAIVADPDYVLARVGLADCYAVLADFGYMDVHQGFSRARDEALQAIALDPEFGPAYTTLAFVKHRYDWDWAGAEDDFRRAIALAPNYDVAHYWYGLYLITVGRLDEARAELDRAAELNPLSLAIVTNAGLPDLYARQYDQAIARFRRALELDPNYHLAHLRLWEAYETLGQHDQAIEELRECLGGAGRRDAANKIVAYYRTMGYEAAIKRWLAEDPWRLAYANASTYARIGERDLALQSLSQSLTRRESRLVYVLQSPDFDWLRSDPKFQQIIGEIETLRRKE